MVLGFALCPLILSVLTDLGVSIPYRQTLWPLGVVLDLLLLAVGGLLIFHGRKSGYEDVVARDFRVCLRCRQSLEGLPDGGVCPECGTGYEHRVLTAVWTNTYG